VRHFGFYKPGVRMLTFLPKFRPRSCWNSLQIGCYSSILSCVLCSLRMRSARPRSRACTSRLESDVQS